MSEYEVEQHFVTFYSPGTMVSETTTQPVDSWDVDTAVTMARNIEERHGATPYAFTFSTRGRAEGQLDSGVVASSDWYYLGGTVKTLAEVEAENDPGNEILIANMRCNGWDRVIVNTNSWRSVSVFRYGDVLLEFNPEVAA